MSTFTTATAQLRIIGQATTQPLPAVLLVGRHIHSDLMPTVTWLLLCGDTGAAIGPQLAGILSRSGWHYVFCMLITAEFAALLVSLFSC